MTSVLRGRPPRTDADRDDLVQDFVTDVLIRQGQIAWIFLHAAELTDMRRLLAFQCRRYLARTRERTVVDNILDRARDMLERPPFIKIGRGRVLRYGAKHSTPDLQAPREDEIWRAAVAATLIPRMPARGAERAPVIYTEERLRELLLVVAETLEGGFALAELRRILDQVLTYLVVGPLVDLEGVVALEDKLSPEQETMVAEAVRQIISSLDAAQSRVLAAKLANVSDGDIARMVGRSRPTVAKTKVEVLKLLEQEMSFLSDVERRAVLSSLGSALVRRPEI